MNQRMIILKQVAIHSDKYSSQVKQMGELAKKAFENKKHQMKQLENIADGAMKVSDVLDYIKRQTGKSANNKKWKKNQFGKKLLEIIENKLLAEGDRIFKNLDIGSEENRLEINLLLIREFIRRMVIHYEFCI